MGNYNPRVPQILGQEWVPIRDVDLTFSPNVNSVELGTSYVQQTVQAINNARFYVNQIQATGQYKQCGLVNLYPHGTEDKTGPIKQVIIPVNSGSVTGTEITIVGGTVANAVLTPGFQDYIQFNYNGGFVTPQLVDFFFAVNQYPQLADKRILNVSLLYSGAVFNFDANGKPVPFVSPNPSIGLSIVRQRNDAGIFQNFTPPTFGTTNTGALDQLGTSINNTQNNPSYAAKISTLDLGDVNNFWDPATDPANTEDRMPWRYTDLQRFEASASNRQHIWMRFQIPTFPWSVNGGSPFVWLDYIALRIIYCEERRIAYGARLFRYNYGMNQITLRDLSFNPNPSVTVGRYLPTLSWVSPGRIDNGQATSGDFPKLNALRELYQLPSHVGTQVNVPFPLTDHLGETFTRRDTPIHPQISLHNASSTLGDPHAYGRQAAAQIWGSNVAAQKILDDIIGVNTTYAQVRYYARRFGNTTVPLKLGSPSFVAGLSLPGIAGNYASTPDHASLDIVGDIDLRADVTLADWTPATFQTLIAKWTVPPQLSYRLAISTNGTIQIAWSADGSSAIAMESTVLVPAADGTRLAVRAILDVDNGAAGRTATFYTAPTISGPWTQLGAPVVQAGVTSIFSSTSIVEVGANGTGGGTEPMTGVVHVIEIRNGIDGTVVANPDFIAQTPGTTSFTDGAGRVWTVNTSGSAAVASIIDTSEVELTPAEWDSLPELVDGWKEITKRFAISPRMGLSIRPSWRWSASGELAGNRWEILAASAPALLGVAGNLYNLVPIQNQLYEATYQPPNGAAVELTWMPQGVGSPFVTSPSADDSSDAVLIFGQDAPAVTGFTVTTLSQPVTGIGQKCGINPCCIPSALAYNRLSWNAVLGAGGLSLPGTAGNYASTPDHASLDIVGDIDIRTDITATNWNSSLFQMTAAKWTFPTQQSYRIGILGGRIRLDWTTDGTLATLQTAQSTVSLPITSGRQCIIAQLDVNNGIGGWTVAFYSGPTIAGPFLQLGAAVVTTSGITSIFSSSSILETGSTNNGIGDMFDGVVHVIEVRNGLGGAIVANPNFAGQTPGTTVFTDSAGRVWTLNGTAAIVNLDNPLIGNIEIQRSDSLNSTFQTIMRATNSTISSFNDYEARVGIQSSYRIRLVDVLNFPGPWSSTVSATMVSPGVTGGCIGNGHVLIFTTNQRQSGSSNLAYSSVWMDGQVSEDFTFPESDFVQLQLMYDRDFATAFRPLERGGERFSRTVLVQAAAIPPKSLADFKSLRDMAWDTVNYICVRDEGGNRWFATVIVPSGKVVNSRKLYLAPVEIIEVTDTPTPVDP